MQGTSGTVPTMILMTEPLMGTFMAAPKNWVSREGEKFTLTWTTENGFQPRGDHLPVAPVHVYELPVTPTLPYDRRGAGSKTYNTFLLDCL
jgi:hypothetical protein